MRWIRCPQVNGISLKIEVWTGFSGDRPKVVGGAAAGSGKAGSGKSGGFPQIERQCRKIWELVSVSHLLTLWFN
jgi:hypothetical protein